MPASPPSTRAPTASRRSTSCCARSVATAASAARELISDLRSQVGGFPVGDVEAIATGHALDLFGQLVEWAVGASLEDALAGAAALLEVAALAISGALYAREVRWVRQHGADDATALEGRFRFFCNERLPLLPGFAARATGGAARLNESFLV